VIESELGETKKRELFYRYFDYFPLLAKGEASSISDVASALGRNDRQVSKELKMLVECGYVILEKFSKEGTKGYRVKVSLTSFGKEELHRYEDSIRSIPVKIRDEDSLRLKDAVRQFRNAKNESSRLIAIQTISSKIYDITSQDRRMIWDDQSELKEFLNGFLMDPEKYERQTRQDINGLFRRLYECGFCDVMNFSNITDYYQKKDTDLEDGARRNEINEAIAIMIISMNKYPGDIDRIYPFLFEMLRLVCSATVQQVWAFDREREKIIGLPPGLKRQMADDVYELANSLPESSDRRTPGLLEHVHELLLFERR
jgi:DNA-binding transcriptional ArsR family regulator